MQDELFYHIALKFVPDIGSAVIKNLVSWCGNAKFIFTTSKGKLQKIPLVGEIRAKKILDKNIQYEAFRKAEKELAFIDKHKIECLFYNDKRYPQRLLQCDDAPSLLFFKGSCDLNHERIVAVVGTRSASEYGKEITKKIVSELSKAGIMIISGLALGIDGVAHTAALANEIPTVGILGHGLNRIYPENHRNLAKQMLTNGGLLTEYSSQCVFHPSNFPQRNRIVAGLCDALLVVETDVKGGAVITANIANSYNREVFAVPGAVGTKSARGCHFLIKTHKAMLIENAEDVIKSMRWDIQGEAEIKRKNKQLQLILSGSEKIIFDLLKDGEKTMDALLIQSGLSAGELSAILLDMEMNDWIVNLPGKRFKLNNF